MQEKNRSITRQVMAAPGISKQQFFIAWGQWRGDETRTMSDRGSFGYGGVSCLKLLPRTARYCGSQDETRIEYCCSNSVGESRGVSRPMARPS